MCEGQLRKEEITFPQICSQVLEYIIRSSAVLGGGMRCKYDVYLMLSLIIVFTIMCLMYLQTIWLCHSGH